MKKILTTMAAVIAIAVAVSGCSKGEDGTEGNNMNTDAKAISADIKSHIIGKWERNGNFWKNFPFANGNTATATFPYTDERPYQKDTLQFFADGRLLITMEEGVSVEATYSVLDPDPSWEIIPLAHIDVYISEEYKYGRLFDFRRIREALFETGYSVLCLYGDSEYMRCRRLE